MPPRPGSALLSPLSRNTAATQKAPAFAGAGAWERAGEGRGRRAVLQPLALGGLQKNQHRKADADRAGVFFPLFLPHNKDHADEGNNR